MPPIFLSYRRDQPADAGRLHSALAERFGPRAAFLDTRAISGGDEYPRELLDALAECTVLVAVITPSWLGARDAFFRRRIDQEHDWVRVELVTALERGIAVVPVLIEDTPPLRTAAFDGPLAAIAEREYVRLRHASWDDDFDRLARALEKHVPRPAVRAPQPVTSENLAHFGAAVATTIARSIGSKYIPSLYVQRGALQRRLLAHARGPSGPETLRDAERRLRECTDALRDLDRRITRAEATEAEARATADAAEIEATEARAAADRAAADRAAAGQAEEAERAPAGAESKTTLLTSLLAEPAPGSTAAAEAAARRAEKTADAAAEAAAATAALRVIRTRIGEFTTTVDSYLKSLPAAPLLRKDHVVWQHRIETELHLIQAEESSPQPGSDDRTVRAALARAERLGKAVVQMADSCRPLFAVVEKAGRGKTNLLCDFATRMSRSVPTVFVAARTLGTGPDALRDAVDAVIAADRGLGARTLAELSAQARCRQIVVCIDGINEAPRPAEFARHLADFLDACHRDDVRTIATCRDEYWPLFVRQLESQAAHTARGELDVFGPREYDIAISKYFRHFDVSGELDGEARAALHDPLLLRFFCEAYAGRRFEPRRPISEIRLLPLFDNYMERKTRTITEVSPHVHPYAVVERIELIATLMARAQSAVLPQYQVARALPSGDTTTRDSPYRLILAEDVIIEETVTHSEIRVAFVYEAFLEYVLSRTLRQGSGVAHARRWYDTHPRFANRIGVLGFYVAHVFTVSAPSFRALFGWLAADPALRVAARLAIENIDIQRAGRPEIELLLATVADDPVAETTQPDDLTSAIYATMFRLRPDQIDALLSCLRDHYDRLMPTHPYATIAVLERLGAELDFVRLLALNERLALPQPTRGLKLNAARDLRRWVDSRPAVRTDPYCRPLLASIARRWAEFRARHHSDRTGWPDNRLVVYAEALDRLTAKHLTSGPLLCLPDVIPRRDS